MEKYLKVAVVVIDEDGSEDTQEAQEEVLFWARMYGHPIACIEYDKTIGGYPSIKTDPELRKMAPADAPVFTRLELAFAGLDRLAAPHALAALELVQIRVGGV